MSKFSEGAADVGTAVGGFLDPLFGAEKVTTTTSGGGSTPESSTKTSSIALAVLAITMVLIAGYFIIKSNKA